MKEEENPTAGPLYYLIYTVFGLRRFCLKENPNACRSMQYSSWDASAWKKILTLVASAWKKIPEGRIAPSAQYLRQDASFALKRILRLNYFLSPRYNIPTRTQFCLKEVLLRHSPSEQYSRLRPWTYVYRIIGPWFKTEGFAGGLMELQKRSGAGMNGVEIWMISCFILLNASGYVSVRTCMPFFHVWLDVHGLR